MLVQVAGEVHSCCTADIKDKTIPSLSDWKMSMFYLMTSMSPMTVPSDGQLGVIEYSGKVSNGMISLLY